VAQPVLPAAYSVWRRSILDEQSFAVVDVNYGGSTGFGRHYRERLLHNWGIVDVEDCQNAARYLVDHGHVDKHRLAITAAAQRVHDFVRADVWHSLSRRCQPLRYQRSGSTVARYAQIRIQVRRAIGGPYPDAKEIITSAHQYTSRSIELSDHIFQDSKTKRFLPAKPNRW